MITEIKKRIIFFLSITLFSIFIATAVFALSYTSPNYILSNARVVVSGGKAFSSYYSVKDARIGNIIGGKIASANYCLNATDIDKGAPATSPNPPTVNPLTTPTNVSTQILSGTKDRGTAIYINGYLAVPLNNDTNWSYELTLQEGNNDFIISAKNRYNLESESIYLPITLDTIPPVIVINSPLDYTIVYASPINIEGTVDGVYFVQEELLSLGINLVSVERSDEAGNTSSQNLEVYRAREPIKPPVM